MFASKVGAWIQNDAPPNSLIDLTTSPKKKTMEGEKSWGVFPGS
jgi:hypothetical protein